MKTIVELSKKYVKSNGYYVIEDLHTSNYKSYYDSENEITTKELLYSLKNKNIIKSNYINENEYLFLLNNIKSIEFYENDLICFINKK